MAGIGLLKKKNTQATAHSTQELLGIFWQIPLRSTGRKKRYRHIRDLNPHFFTFMGRRNLHEFSLFRWRWKKVHRPSKKCHDNSKNAYLFGNRISGYYYRENTPKKCPRKGDERCQLVDPLRKCFQVVSSSNFFFLEGKCCFLCEKLHCEFPEKK